MIERNNFNPERQQNSQELATFEFEQLADIIRESDDAFLPPANDPGQTASTLFDKLQHVPGFQPYGFVVDNVPASYIVALGHKVPSTISIGPMYVATDYQGRGLGALQVNMFLDKAKDDGYQAVYTKTWSENLASQRIFESLGFEIIGVIPNDRANGDATIEYMVQFT